MTQEQFDRYMTELDLIADRAVAGVDMSTFTLTPEEREALGTIPEELIERLTVALSRYIPVGPDNRAAMATKALVQAWMRAPFVRAAIKAGYEATS